MATTTMAPIFLLHAVGSTVRVAHARGQDLSAPLVKLMEMTGADQDPVIVALREQLAPKVAAAIAAGRTSEEALPALVEDCRVILQTIVEDPGLDGSKGVEELIIMTVASAWPEISIQQDADIQAAVHGAPEAHAA